MPRPGGILRRAPRQMLGGEQIRRFGRVLNGTPRQNLLRLLRRDRAQRQAARRLSAATSRHQPVAAAGAAIGETGIAEIPSCDSPKQVSCRWSFTRPMLDCESVFALKCPAMVSGSFIHAADGAGKHPTEGPRSWVQPAERLNGLSVREADNTLGLDHAEKYPITDVCMWY